jgi:hypothetical protein
MNDLYQVLSQKEMDVERVRREIKALHFVIPLLAENADWIENGLAAPLSVSQFRGTRTADVTRRGALISGPLPPPALSGRLPGTHIKD